MNKKDLKTEIKKGEIVQIITDSFNGGVGKLDTINDSFIKLTPFEDEALTEESGSIAHEIIFPLKEIKLLIKVNMEVIKENAKQTV